jgi:hypothetical protein
MEFAQRIGGPMFPRPVLAYEDPGTLKNMISTHVDRKGASFGVGAKGLITGGQIYESER